MIYLQQSRLMGMIGKMFPIIPIILEYTDCTIETIVFICSWQFLLRALNHCTCFNNEVKDKKKCVSTMFYYSNIPLSQRHICHSNKCLSKFDQIDAQTSCLCDLQAIMLWKLINIMMKSVLLSVQRELRTLPIFAK